MNNLFGEEESIIDPVEPNIIDLEALLSEIRPDKLAYHLAFSDPEFGNKLLEELLYYRSLGRI